MTEPHKIQRQIFDVKLSENKNVHDLQNKLSTAFNDSLLSIIGEQLDKITPNGESIVIDRLEIDLGTLKMGSNFEPLLKERLTEQLKEQIIPIQREVSFGAESGKYKIEPKSSEIVWSKESAKKTDIEKLIFFLENGYFSWSARLSSKSIVDESAVSESWVSQLVDKVLKENPKVFQRYVKRHIHLTAIQQRIFHNFSLNQIKKVIEGDIFSELALSGKDLLELLTEIVLSGKNTHSVTEKKSKRIIWSLFAVLARVESQERRKYLLLPTLMMFVAQEYAFFEMDLQELMKRTANEDQRVQHLRKHFRQLGIDLKTIAESVPPIFITGQNREEFDSGSDVKQTIEEWFEQRRNIQKLESVLPVKGNKWFEAWSEYVEENTGTAMDLKILSEMDDTDAKEEPSLPEKALGDEENGISVSNSGLVILGYFLPYLFDYLGWLDAEKKIREDAYPKALSMTQFLSTGQEEVDESLLPLNKIMLGIDVHEVLTNDYKLTNEEKSEGEHLLENVVSKWDALGSTSVNGLRQTFIERPGIIYEHDENFLLRVERKSLDILLDRLPWSIGVVKLRWMPKTIIVEW